MREARLTRESSDLPSDFLLKLALVGSALVTAPCAKNDVTEESKAAKMWMIFLGFMNQEQRNALGMASMARRVKNSNQMRMDLTLESATRCTLSS